MKLPRLHRQLRSMAQAERQMDRMLAEQASEWVEVMRKPTLLDRLVFARWLKKHERHAAEFMVMEGIDRALEGIDSQRRHNVAALLAASAAEVVSLPSDFEPRIDERKLLRGHRRSALTAAATVGLIAIAAWWALPRSGLIGQEVRTRTGEQRVLELEDGSTIFVNTQSRVRVRLSQQSRDIQLLSGEALFKVEPDATRPFRVHAGGATIRAIGTQFNVHSSPAGTQVVVIEGKVEVQKDGDDAHGAARTALAAGEGASIAADRPAGESAGKLAGRLTGRLRITRMDADLEKTTAWRQRRVMFRLDTLEDIAAEFNRYNRVPQIRVDGELVRSRRLSGVFDADNPQAFAATLSGDQTLTISKTDREIVISGR